MLARLDAWSARLLTGPNRIALSTALRGTIATVVPLVALPQLGLGAAARLAVIGALNTSMVDVGGPYRSRLIMMGINAVVSPCLMLAGMQVTDAWWLAAPLMFAAALAAGLTRALGPNVIPLGLNTSIAVLIGIQIAGGTGSEALQLAAGYVAGAVWTITVALAFWWLRPYRRLEQEVAIAWEAVAELVAAVHPLAHRTSVVARRRRERRIAQRHRAVRDAVERARAALGETRAATYGPGTIMSALLVLMRAASRIGAAAVTIGTVGDAPAARGDDDAVQAALGDALDELERACRAMARLLLTGRGEVSFEAMRRQPATLIAQQAHLPIQTGRAIQAEAMALAQAVRHLDNAEEVARLLFGRGSHRLHLRYPRGDAGGGMRALFASLRAHLTMRSMIFRHATRVALVAAVGTAVIVRWHVPHGIWLPMTALVIAQPDYGGTLNRALQRTAGTIAGAVLAGVLLATLHGTAAYEIAIALLLFATFLLIRRRYGVAITFLTPLIILLLDLGGPDAWLDLRNRLIDTAGGAALALVAGYVLWPQWERERLPDRLARAVRADKAYLAAVLDALAGTAVPAPRLADLRREAEIEAGNADAAFQRMLGEPQHQRGPVGQGFVAVTYVQRLARHTLALAGHLDAAPLTREHVAALRRLLDGTLEDVAAALAQGRPAAPRPDFDEPLGRVQAALAASDEGIGRSAGFLLGQIVSDTTSLNSAVEAR